MRAHRLYIPEYELDRRKLKMTLKEEFQTRNFSMWLYRDARDTQMLTRVQAFTDNGELDAATIYTERH